MSVPKVEEMDRPLVIGQNYQVLCTFAQPFHSKEKIWTPLFGNMHADTPDTGAGASIVGKFHIHIDMRFMTDELLKAFGFTPFIQGVILTHNESMRLYKLEPGVIVDLSEKKYQVMKCLRQWPALVPTLTNHRRRFENRYENQKFDPRCMRCPHQGIDLSNIESVELNGREQVICPAHLLAWDCKTGEMIRRTNKDIKYLE